MPIINSIAGLHEEITAWRRDFHENPELLYDVHRTAGIVADKLKAFGCDEVVTGVGRTGVVGIIRGRSTASGRVIGMRADMDALPVEEITGLPYASKIPGKMHACGHDGHTAMLLGAAKHLADTRNFNGTAVVIFQPAEEGGAGGKAMCDDGMMARFGIQEVYGLHNMPGVPVGAIATRKGPLLAASDTATIIVEGKGGHGSAPHKSVDTILAGANIVMALQSIVARNLDPLKSGVISVGAFRSGHISNVLPQTAELMVTVRSQEPAVRDLLQQRITETAEGIALSYGAVARVAYKRGYPPTINDDRATDFAMAVAKAVCGDAQVDGDTAPLMGSEDFSYMLQERPGNMIFLGNGDTAMCHHPAYDFNDAIIPVGVSYWVGLAEMGMPHGH
jgi:amidohydrolase